MGFLKFLKKSKKDKLEMSFEEDLDIPPPPPISAKELPPMPNLEEPFSKPEEKIPSFPDLEPIKEHGIPEEIPEPPEIPRFEEKIKPIPPKPIPILKPEVTLVHEVKKVSPLERIERAAIREESGVLRHEEVPLKPIFISIDKFREIKRGIGIIRNDLKSADEVLIKMQDMGEVKDKQFNNWQKTIGDIQKKLIFIDQTLLKGDKHER